MRVRVECMSKVDLDLLSRVDKPTTTLQGYSLGVQKVFGLQGLESVNGFGMRVGLGV